MKKSLIITLTDLDPETAEGHDKLNDIYGASNFAVLQGDGGNNTQIALIKLLREMTGSQLIPAKDAANIIIKAIKDLGGLDDVRDQLKLKIDKMSGNELLDFRSYMKRTYNL